MLAKRLTLAPGVETAFEFDEYAAKSVVVKNETAGEILFCDGPFDATKAAHIPAFSWQSFDVKVFYGEKPKFYVKAAVSGNVEIDFGSQMAGNAPGAAGGAAEIAGGTSIIRGTATGGSSTTVADTTQNWPVNMWVNKLLKLQSGSLTFIRQIVSNTANTITVAELAAAVNASCQLFYGTDYAVGVTKDLAGAAGNEYNVVVTAETGEGHENVNLGAVLSGKTITVTLGTDANGDLDATKNEAALVAGAINGVDGFTAIALASESEPVVTLVDVALEGGVDAYGGRAGDVYEIVDAGVQSMQLSGSKTPDYTIPVMDITAWSSGFTNQPNNDGIEVISNSASDTQKITIFGTTVTTGAFCYETITLNGVGAVATTKTNWGNIVGAFLGEIDGTGVVPAVGTITIREASGDQTITTIAAGKISKGMVVFDLNGKDISTIVVSGNVYGKQFALGATTFVTVANGLLLNLTAGNIIDCTPKASNLIGFISDASSATMQILVWS